MSTAADVDTDALVDRFTLKALVESCLVLEEGLASMKDIDLGMMAGAGIIPPPFARADQIGLDDLLGLDTVLHVAEYLYESYGDRFYVHKQMQDLVAAGDLGAKTGKGFYEHGS